MYAADVQTVSMESRKPPACRRYITLYYIQITGKKQMINENVENDGAQNHKMNKYWRM